MSTAIDSFVNKRRNIFTALKMDIDDKACVNSFNQNFFLTEVNDGGEEEEEDIQEMLESIDQSPDDALIATMKKQPSVEASVD